MYTDRAEVILAILIPAIWIMVYWCGRFRGRIEGREQMMTLWENADAD